MELDVDIAEVKPSVVSGRSARVIACEDPAVFEFDRQGVEVEEREDKGKRGRTVRAVAERPNCILSSAKATLRTEAVDSAKAEVGPNRFNDRP